MAWAYGYADGDVLPIDLVIATIAAAVKAATKRVGCAIEIVGGYVPMAAPHGAHSLIADFAGCVNWVQAAAAPSTWPKIQSWGARSR